jgi:hypothetical protein
MSNIVIDSHKFYLTPAGASLKRNGVFNSNLEFTIPNLYQSGVNVQYATIRCVHAEIPYSFYIVNEYNNLLSLSTGDIYIPFGNYNANSFMKYLAGVLPTDMQLGFNTTNGKYVLLYNQPFSINASSTCSILMGFAKQQVYNSNETNKIEMPYLANLSGTKNIYVKIPNLILDNYNSATKDRATLLNIPINVSPFGIIMYENSSGSSNIIKSIQIPDTLILQLTDDENNLIDFNSTEFSITIQIDFYLSVYKNNNQP